MFPCSFSTIVRESSRSNARFRIAANADQYIYLYFQKTGHYPAHAIRMYIVALTCCENIPEFWLQESLFRRVTRHHGCEGIVYRAQVLGSFLDPYYETSRLGGFFHKAGADRIERARLNGSQRYRVLQSHIRIIWLDGDVLPEN